MNAKQLQEGQQDTRAGSLNGGVSNGGVSRSGLVLPFLSFLSFWDFPGDFPDLLGDGPGIFPICSFSSFSAY